MDRRGATFVEVAVATLFLALAMVPLMDSILSGSRRAREDKMRTFATALASSTIERYRLESPGSCAAAIGGANSDPLLVPADPPPGWAELRNKFRVIPEFTAGGTCGTLTVAVTWDESGQERKVEMKCLVCPSWAVSTS